MTVGVRWTVGFDGSPGAIQAAEWAATHAAGRAESIRLLHAVPRDTRIRSASGVTRWHQEPATTAPTLEPSAVATDLTVHRGVPVLAESRLGDPATVLLDAAAHSDLLVLGSRGVGRIERALRGSTSALCLAYAEQPTIVVPRRRVRGTLQRVAEIVVAVDGSDDAWAALDWACRFAKPGSHISVLVVRQSTPTLFSSETLYLPATVARVREQLEQLLATTRTRPDAADVAIDGELVFGRLRHVITGRAARADLVVLGHPEGATSAAGLRTSMAAGLLHNAGRPVVVVPTPADHVGCTGSDPRRRPVDTTMDVQRPVCSD